MSEQKKWTLKQLQEHLRMNRENTYSMAVPLAALYKKLYGELPHFGLSGAQAEYAEVVFKKLP